MYGLRGNRAREKTALTPDPLRRSSFGCTTLDSRRMDMDIGMQIRSEFNLNSPNSLRIRSKREFAANSA